MQLPLSPKHQRRLGTAGLQEGAGTRRSTKAQPPVGDGPGCPGKLYPLLPADPATSLLAPNALGEQEAAHALGLPCNRARSRGWGAAPMPECSSERWVPRRGAEVRKAAMCCYTDASRKRAGKARCRTESMVSPLLLPLPNPNRKGPMKTEGRQQPEGQERGREASSGDQVHSSAVVQRSSNFQEWKTH